VNANDSSLASFSSLGPTFDGRIKPDVVAAGNKNFLPKNFDLSSLITMHIDYIYILDKDNSTIEKYWDFNEPGNFQGWFQNEKHEIYNIKVSNGLLSFQTKIGGYGFVHDVNLVAKESHAIVMRYRIETQDSQSFQQKTDFLWKVDGSFHEVDDDDGNPKKVPNYVDGKINYYAQIDNDFHEVEIPVGQLGLKLEPIKFGPIAMNGWQGNISRLGIWPINGSGSIVSTWNVGGAYIEAGGTSMSAPAVTGTVALMLEQFLEKGKFVTDMWEPVNLDDNPPLPSTIKAILIQTATDLIHGTADPRNPNNPDTGTPVLYYRGPDFATGYGLVNAKAAVDFIEDAAGQRLIHESGLGNGEEEVYEINVTSPHTELKVTLAWDDVEGNFSLGDQRYRRLVNDIDLVLIDPNGKWHHPWRLDPLPVADCGGAGPGCGDSDLISYDDIKPAYKGPDARNNVEQVQVGYPVVSTGKWKVLVSGLDVELSGITVETWDDALGEPVYETYGTQTYSLVSNTPLTKVVDAIVPSRIKGDLNGDRKVELQDYEMMMTHIYNVRDYNLRDSSFDLNQDRNIDLVDAFFIVPAGWSNFIVNNLVNFEVLWDSVESKSIDEIYYCPEGYSWKYNFTARLGGPLSELHLSDLLIRVKSLTDGCILQNAIGGPAMVGALLQVPKNQGYSDGLLSYPYETVDVRFEICLKEKEPFSFSVEVLGIKR